MTLLAAPTDLAEPSIRRDQEAAGPATLDVGLQQSPVEATSLPESPSSQVATPISPVPSHRRGVDEEIGISPLPPLYTRDVPPRHSVVSISSQSPHNLRTTTPTAFPPGPEDEPLPEYSRFPKSEAAAVTAAYRSDDNSSIGSGRKKICGIYMRTLVTGIIILITACVIVGGVVGYQIKVGWANAFQGSSTNSPTSQSNYGPAPPGATWYSGTPGGATMSNNDYSTLTTPTPTVLLARAPRGRWKRGA